MSVLLFVSTSVSP